MRWHGGQHLLFAVNQVAGVEACNFEAMPVRDGVGRTSVGAIATTVGAARIVEHGQAAKALGQLHLALGERRGAMALLQASKKEIEH